MTRPHFDPYAILRELENERVSYVLVGALARVIQGSDELTDGLDLTPSARQKNLDRLQAALERLNARRVDGQPLNLTEDTLSRNPMLELAKRRRRDQDRARAPRHPRLRRPPPPRRPRADRRRPPPCRRRPRDLVRMLEALGREHDRFTIETMQRAMEIDRGLSWER